MGEHVDQMPKRCTFCDGPHGHLGLHLPSFADASAEPPLGAVGAHEAVAEEICQLFHGMSLAEYQALPEPHDHD